MTPPVASGDGSPSRTPRKRTCEPWRDGYGAMDVHWPITPIKPAFFERPARSRLLNNYGEMRFLPEWEQRFTVTARNPRDVHRRLGREQHLEEILSVRVARKVAQDHTVSWDGNRWGVAPEEVCAGLRGAAVEIERRLDGSHWLCYC